MEFVLASLPWPVRTPEHDPVTFTKEHLGGTAGVALGIIRQILIDKADIADARPHIEELPRRIALCLVIKACSNIPSHCRWVLRLADFVASGVSERFRR